MKALPPAMVAQLVQLCSQPSSQRSQDDIWFIRDRLHECSSFFKLWPSHLQQLLCRLVQARQWVQHEVLAAAGSKPEELCFIVEGQAAVAVRSAPGSSLLKDVATLHAGDTFGESCLLNKQRHPAFVVVRSAVLIGLTVNAQALAAALPAALKQARVAGAPSTANQTLAAGQLHQVEQQDAVSVDRLYQLIGEPRGAVNAKLQPHTADQVKRLHSRQLQEAAAAEAATVGTWQQLPHQRLSQPSSVQATIQQSHVGQYASALPGEVQDKEGSDADGMRSSAGGSSNAAPGSNEQQQEAVGPTEEQPQKQQAPRSPLMHHAAIMHFAALRAAAVGQPGC